MLTSDLLRVRTYRSEIRPRYLKENDEEALALAGQLVDVFERHVRRARHELNAELRDLLGTGTDFLLHRALAKLLLDRSTFDDVAGVEPEAVRQATFTAAAAAYQAPHSDADPHTFRLDREAVLETAAKALKTDTHGTDSHAIDNQQIEEWLYADLKDEEILVEHRQCSPEWLVRRYNVALAQGVLLRASELRLTIAGQEVRAYRELFRKIKFFQLMHRIKAVEDGYEIVLDGPVSLFQASGKYGLQMASFLPTLLHFDGWELEADLRWGKRRLKRKFRLSAKSRLTSHTTLRGQYQPEELKWLPQQLAELDKGWTATMEGELVNLGGQGVLVPDYVFHHEATDTRVFMEVFGFWNKGAVKSRVRLLKKHGPKNLILAISKRLAAGQEGLDELPGEVYVFRDAPLARKVAKLLDGYLPKKKKRRRKSK